MCRFLLQHGADVDHVANYTGPFGFRSDYIGPALDACVNDDEAEDDELKSILICRKLLLEAGCDPTIPIVDEQGRHDGDVVGDTLWFGVPVRKFCTHQPKQVAGANDRDLGGN